jgi:PAS domain S-box-containing protein
MDFLITGAIAAFVATLGVVSVTFYLLKELRESKERLRKIIETTSDWIWAVDEKAVYTYASPSIQDILGYKPEEVLGKTPFDFMPPDEAKRVANIFGPIVLAREPIPPLENTNIRKDGHPVVLETKGAPVFDKAGRFCGYLGIDRDISERKKVEEELEKHRKQLEVLVEQRTAEVVEAKHLASLGELAAGVAHEINNPINGIVNYGQLLVKKLAENSPEKDIAGRILKEGDRIVAIVRSLLSYGNAGRDEKKNIHHSEILTETLTLTAAQIRKDGIHLETDIAENLPIVVGNLQQLQQVFLNVISNARYALNGKYPGSHSDKILEIKCEGVTIEDVHYVRISFLDHGTGIPADILDKIMNPFFSTKPAGHGTGLGLSISNSIIKDHGGRLALESKEGEYTRVIIDLPVRIQTG